jgi:2-C-methyl-D-erythritol 4-phosphate cytidylyltransferase
MLRSVIIVAGGKGLRMGAEVPKQFLFLDGRPLLMHTIEAFYHTDPSIRIVLVLPKEQQSYWLMLCYRFQFFIGCRIAEGGNTRFQSVKNGLALLPNDGYIAVHDGVRPFVSQEVIRRCFEEVEHYRAVVPVVSMIESVRKVISEDESEAVVRDHYKLVQTPQVFEASLLHQAYTQTYSSSFTDDASVVEALGCKIHLTEGNRENQKITTPYDMMVANAYLKWQQ